MKPRSVIPKPRDQKIQVFTPQPTKNRPHHQHHHPHLSSEMTYMFTVTSTPRPLHVFWLLSAHSALVHWSPWETQSSRGLASSLLAQYCKSECSRVAHYTLKLNVESRNRKSVSQPQTLTSTIRFGFRIYDYWVVLQWPQIVYECLPLSQQ